LSKYSNTEIKNTETKLRNKYMKCLNYKTPQEVFDIEIERLTLKRPQQCGMIMRELIIN